MIIIKGMEMPVNCMLCPFIDESGQYCQVDGKVLVPNILCVDIEGVRENFKVLKSGRHADCPLIEIRERIKKMKKYKVQLIETYAFDFEVEAENRAEAEEKAKNYVDNYTDDDYFACSANSHVKDVFKIISKTDGDE